MSLDHEDELVKHQSVSLDAFLGGKLVLAQPLRGFRAGLDSVILGAAVRPGSPLSLDLGAGVGTAGLVALAHEPEAQGVLVERDADMAALAAANCARNGLAQRAAVMTLDLTDPKVRDAAGLRRDGFSTIIANPPYYDDARDLTPAPDRAGARQMPGASLGRWVSAALTHAAPRGEIIFIHQAAALPELLALLSGKLGAITVLPLSPRAGEAALRVLVRGIKGSRGPFTLLASRALHTETGRGFSPDFDAIFKGNDRLHW
jgi:tRNA1(Val) A37 N6-methylase TrmN6